jgi:hypothetical protein
MSNQEAASLAFKLAGIYVLTEAITSLFGTGLLWAGALRSDMGMQMLNRPTVLVLTSVPTVFLVALGAGLIRYSRPIAEAMFEQANATPTSTMTPSELQAVLLTVLGVSMIASAVPHFARLALYFGPPAESTERSVLAVINQYWPEFVQRSSAVVIGAMLILGRRGFSAGWSTVRRAWLVLRGRQDELEEI